MKRYFWIYMLAVALVLSSFTACRSTRSADTTAKIEELRKSGIESFRAKDYEAAAKVFKEAASLCGNDKDALYADVKEYYATCLYRQGDYANAIKEYEALTGIADKEALAEAYYLEGCCYIALQDENSAVAAFEKSLKQDATNYDTYCKMYEAFCDAGYKERGESYLKRVISDGNASNITTGKTYFYLGNYADAESYLLKAMDEDENTAFYFLGVCYEISGDYAKAEDFYTKYLSKNPEDPIALNQYGAYLIGRAEYEKALTMIEKALSLPDQGDALQALMYNQAICYEYLNDYVKALQLMRTYVLQYPNDSDAAKELDFLETR